MPDPYREVMEELCEFAPQSPYEDVKKTIESSFNAPIDEIFSGNYINNFIINTKIQRI